jgi:hypothetical protein
MNRKFNFILHNFKVNKLLFKNFSTPFEGIKGDVNWKDGKLIDARPNIRRHKQLPRKEKGFSVFNTLEENLNDLSKYKYVTYNSSSRRRKLGTVEDKKT